MDSSAIVQHLLLCAILIDATLGWAVLIKQPKHATHQGYFFVICSITLWQVATFVSMFFFHLDAERIFSFRLMYAAVTAELLCILYFVNIFGQEKHHRAGMIASSVAVLAQAVLVIATPWVFVSSSGTIIATGYLYPYYIFLVCALIAGVFASIIQRLIMVDDLRQRTQLEYMMIGLFVPMLFGVFSAVIVPFLEGGDGYIRISSMQVFGAATTVFFSFVMAYAMARHRLMDVRITVKRKSIALLLAVLSTLLMIGIVLFAVRDTVRFDAWTSVTTLVTFGVVSVLMYEVMLKTTGIFLKRGVVDLTAYTRDEERFMRKIESPRTWARRWAGKLQKQFGVEALECITYDHRAQCWRQVFPESRVKYALEEEWVAAVQAPAVVVCQVGDGEVEPVAQRLIAMKREVLIAMHDSFRCMGVWVMGKKLDGTKWTAKDVAVLKTLAHEAEQELWYVMQQEYTLIMAMENGAELPRELLVDDEEI